MLTGKALEKAKIEQELRQAIALLQRESGDAPRALQIRRLFEKFAAYVTDNFEERRHG